VGRAAWKREPFASIISKIDSCISNEVRVGLLPDHFGPQATAFLKDADSTTASSNSASWVDQLTAEAKL